ncbi:MAG TPA: hypothetical protein VFW94_00205 [Candidatus Acidoferrales bacterium]|nr:hypothetical protein [Candidatus Acidoferrales bacterium]
MFYFEQLLQTALNGIDAANVTAAALGVAGTILLLSFLYSAYQAFAAGGDVRMLAISGIKYLILGLVFASYGAVFRDVNAMFNSVANFIYNSTGVGDLFANWMNQLSQYWQTNGSTSLWNLVTGLASGVISFWLILGAFVIFPVCYLIFTIFYALYGSVLYVTGPFVLALLPTRGLGQLSRTYLVNLMTFQAWGLIYAIIQVLMSAVNLSSIGAVLGANGVLNSFVGSSEMILLALTASIFSFSIALIPFIASRIVRGDVGSTMLTMVGTMAAAASAVASLAAASFVGVGEGALAGRSAGSGPPPPPPPPPPAAGGPAMAPSAPPVPVASSGSGMGVAAASSSSLSPTPASPSGTGETAASSTPSSPTPSSPSPWRASSHPGQYRGFNIPHAMAWYVGYSLGSAYRGVRGKE